MDWERVALGEVHLRSRKMEVYSFGSKFEDGMVQDRAFVGSCERLANATWNSASIPIFHSFSQLAIAAISPMFHVLIGAGRRRMLSDEG